jgi:hypothetical protein
VLAPGSALGEQSFRISTIERERKRGHNERAFLVYSVSNGIRAAGHAVQSHTGASSLLAGFNRPHVELLPQATLDGFLPAYAGGLARSGNLLIVGGIANLTGRTSGAQYGTGAANVKLQIVDTGNNGVRSFAMGVLANTRDQQSATGFERTLAIGDVKVHESWRDAGRHAELMGLVGERFVVRVISDGLDISRSEQAIEAVDLGRLEAMAADALRK